MELNNSYYDDITMGKVMYHKKYWKFGEGKVTTSLTTIWSGNEEQTGLYQYPTEAINMDVVSSNASDTQKIKIEGLNENWKETVDEVTLDGTNPVTTNEKFIRVFRVYVSDGDDLIGNVSVTETGETSPLYAYINNDNAVQNQSQMTLFTVPAGHVFIQNSVDVSTIAESKVNALMAIKNDNSPFRVQLNYNVKSGNVQYFENPPIKWDEKTDIEMRGFTEAGSELVTASISGYMVQTDSVPVDTYSLSTSYTPTSFTVNWEALSDADSADQEAWQLTIDGRDYILPKSQTSYFFDDAVTGETYDITLKFVGYDDKLSSGKSTTVTPGVVTNYVVASGFNPQGATTKYFLSTDEGDSWETKDVGLGNWSMSDLAISDNYGFAIYNDNNDVEDPRLYKTNSGSSWSQVSGIIPGEIIDFNDFAIVKQDSGAKVTFDGNNWVDTNPTSLNISNRGIKFNGNYYVISYDQIMVSSDGINWSYMSSQPSTGSQPIESLATNGVNMLITYNALEENNAAPTYMVSSGGTWTTAGTSTMSGTNINGCQLVYYDGKYHSFTFEDDFSGSYHETSTDGTTWTDETSVLPSGSLALGAIVVGDILYLSLADSSFNGSVMTKDESGWNTPVAFNETGIISINIDGKA